MVSEGGSGTPPADPNPGGETGGDKKTFTQDEVNTIVQNRLEKDRKSRGAEKLIDEERNKLMTELEGKDRTIYGLKTELDGTKTKLKEVDTNFKDVTGRFKAALVNRAIGAAASAENAVDPEVVSGLLEGRVRVRELTEDGKPTGENVVEVRVERERDGKQEHAWVTAQDGVKDLLVKKPFLVKSSIPSGTGTPAAKKPSDPAPSKLPEGVVKSEMTGVGHIPKGANPGGNVGDLFHDAGNRLQERIRTGK